jgi:hypothetical protein
LKVCEEIRLIGEEIQDPTLTKAKAKAKHSNEGSLRQTSKEKKIILSWDGRVRSRATGRRARAFSPDNSSGKTLQRNTTKISRRLKFLFKV